MLKSKPMNEGSQDVTIISNGVKVEGKISSDSSMRIDGTIQGDINCQQNVTIGEHGDVNGKVNGQSITIGGKVHGSVSAKQKLILESKSQLKGDVFTKILVVEAGANFDGKSNMVGAGESTSSTQPKP